MILQARGYGVLWALAMSVFIYAGSMQYVAIDLLSGGVSVLDYLYWIAGSVIGSVLGSVLPFSTEGIDFSLTALFLTVFVEQWLTTKNHLAAIVGVVASVLCLLLFGRDQFLIPAMILITLLLTLMQKKEGITND